MNALQSQIEAEIRREGPISCARFMELALYAPGLGYYERQREIGRGGDFFTSVSVGPLFGELLAFQFAQWRQRGKLQLVEAGAHGGALAGDILGWLERSRPEIFSRLEYGLIEPSPIRRQWQEDALRPWQSKIKWLASMDAIKPDDAFLVIFSNELLDALPVHRFAWNADGKKWEECRVTCGQGGFAWVRGPLPPGAGDFPQPSASWPGEFIIERSPAAVEWWRSAAGILACGPGKLLTIDYGLSGHEHFGTLRAFARHHAGGNIFDNVGECDITAHVDFSAIEAAGVAAGLKTEKLVSQEKFLVDILAATQAHPGGFAEWTAARVKQFQTLTHPNHLGRAFRVLIQSNGN